MFKNEVHCLLTVEEMERADAAAIALGISGERLMEAAGKAGAHAAISYGQKRISVLCGPGNNGGDGFVIAPTHQPGAFEDFVDLVVPELQRRGLFREEYTGATLRENLGLRIPNRVG